MEANTKVQRNTVQIGKHLNEILTVRDESGIVALPASMSVVVADTGEISMANFFVYRTRRVSRL
jgi:hypothetical protein